jgi:hypothetical protein
MNGNGPVTGGGLPDPGGLNIEYGDAATFEPSDEQLELLRADLESIAARVRPHLTRGFTVSTRLTDTQIGPQGHVVVSFPTGDAIGPGIQLTADMFEAAGESDWDGPIPPEKIEAMSRKITTIAVAQWAEMTGLASGDRVLPAK